MCYRKQEAYKEGNRSPKAHQLTCSTVFPRYDDSDTSFTEEEEEPFCLQLKILDDSPQEEQSEAEQSQPGEKIAQSNRHSKKPKKAMQLKKPAKSIQSINDKNYQAERSENNDYKSQVSQAYQEKRRPRKSQMCSDKKSQEPSYMWLVMSVIVNTEVRQLSTPTIRSLCQDEKCQSTRCYKKKSPVRPQYKYDKNCQSGSSSEKESPDPKKMQMIYEANEAPSTKAVKEYKLGCDQYEAESQEKLQAKQITSISKNGDTEFQSSNSKGHLRPNSLIFKYVYSGLKVQYVQKNHSKEIAILILVYTRFMHLYQINS